MKLHASLVFLCILFLAAATAFGQAGCNFNITGDWEATAPDHAGPSLYRFAGDGTVTVLPHAGDGGKTQKPGTARYRFAGAPNARTLEFKPVSGREAFPWRAVKMAITQLDGASFTTVMSGRSTTWTKKDSRQYYIVLGARRGTPPHHGGPAFAALIKSGGTRPEIESFGLFYRDSERINGPIPDDLYRQFTSDSSPPDGVVLRLKISSQAYESALKVVRSWQERAREGTLLFPSYSYLNVIVPLKDVAESLTQCGESFHIYKLTWMVDDELGANVPQWELAFAYVKKLREMNEQSHVSSAEFQQNITSRLAVPLPKN